MTAHQDASESPDSLAGQSLGAARGYAAMVCPNCEKSDAMRTQYGAWVCDRCDVAHGYNHIVAWNKGFEAGKRHNEPSSPTREENR